jgi:hypothetical protein
MNNYAGKLNLENRIRRSSKGAAFINGGSLQRRNRGTGAGDSASA